MASVLCTIQERSIEAGSLRTGTRIPKQATKTTVSVLPGFSIYGLHHCYNATKSFDSPLKVGHKETHLVVVACHEDSNLCLELEASKPRDKFHMTQCRLHSTTPASSCVHSSFLFVWIASSTAYIFKDSPCSDHSKALKLMREKKLYQAYCKDLFFFFYNVLLSFKIKLKIRSITYAMLAFMEIIQYNS